MNIFPNKCPKNMCDQTIDVHHSFDLCHLRIYPDISYRYAIHIICNAPVEMANDISFLPSFLNYFIHQVKYSALDSTAVWIGCFNKWYYIGIFDSKNTNRKKSD